MDSKETPGVGGFKIQDYVPISYQDVHRFMEEISEDNLNLINQINEQIETFRERDDQDQVLYI